MVTQPLSLETKGSLRRTGYRLDTTYGWDTHEIPLYAHKGTNLAARGEEAFKMRVGNLKRMDNAEAQYVARKGAVGLFMWPLEECFEHEFTNVRLESRPGGGIVETRDSKKVMGCKWCREASPNNGLQEDVEQLNTDVSAEPAADNLTVSTPPATNEEIVKCLHCPEVMKATSSSGRPRTLKQRRHALTLHMKKHAS